jgi:flagellar basal-body rod protein FlgB
MPLVTPGRTAILLDSLFETLPALQGSLNGLSARQKAIGENIANADTPHYKRLQVSFEGNLKKALGAKAASADDLGLKTDSRRHFSLGPNAENAPIAEVSKVKDETYRNDGNNVNIDLEMANLAETNIRYNTMAKLAKDHFEGLKTILREVR